MPANNCHIPNNGTTKIQRNFSFKAKDILKNGKKEAFFQRKRGEFLRVAGAKIDLVPNNGEYKEEKADAKFE